MVSEIGYEEALDVTNKLLEMDEVVIYEAAILHDGMFVRVDILEKKGGVINLVEVKSKSLDFTDESGFLTKKGTVQKKWEPYLVDIAFQAHVARLSFSGYTIVPHVMMPNKNNVATVDGLNQKFKLSRVGGRVKATVNGDVGLDSLGEKLLVTVPVIKCVTDILSGESFIDSIKSFKIAANDDVLLVSPVTHECLKCQYNAGAKSGMVECFNRAGMGDFDFVKAPVTKLWNYRGKGSLWGKGVFHMEGIIESDIYKVDANDVGLVRERMVETITCNEDRQWLQVVKTNAADDEPFIDIDGLRAELSKHVYPLHFIDFETSRVAIPFTAGRKPYEQVAFQFSHHVMYEDGSVKHAGEYFHTVRGGFPNYDFIRALKAELDKDGGTIFKYATHENTVLNDIKRQLEADGGVSDRVELVQFIDTITNDKSSGRVGERDMVDMCDLVKRFYYHRLMGGSNSIKVVLPAVLNTSEYIKEKYSKPVYGRGCEIDSLNYDSGMVWVNVGDDGSVINPYKLLQGAFDGVDGDFTGEDEINNGGAAMTAYAQMQFSEMSDEEFLLMRAALLRYCELDTLAMVMIYEYWKDVVNE